jgi:peroxiredoxin
MIVHSGLVRASVLSLALLLAWTMPAGSTPTVGQTGAGGQDPPRVAPAGGAEKARAVLEQAFKRYRELDAYEDRMETRFECQARPDAELKGGFSVPDWSSTALAFSRAKRIALTSEGHRVICDGQTLWRISDDFEEYTEEPAEEPAELARQTVGLSLVAHPLAPFFIDRDQSVDDLLRSIFHTPQVDIQDVEPLARDGRPGQSVRIALRVPIPGLENGVPLRMWFDDETGELREIRYDMRQVLELTQGASGESEDAEDEDEEDISAKKSSQKRRDKGPQDEPLFSKAEMSLVFTDIRFNPVLPPERFAFKPDPMFEKVEDLSLLRLIQAQPIRQIRLIGKPAPDFAAQDLDGQPFRSADAAGRALVLVFWESLSRDSRELLRDAQAIADRYAEKGVLVVGVNQDGSATAERVRQAAVSRAAKFRQLLDADGQLGRAFSIRRLPGIVLIDPQGQIQDVSGDAADLPESLPDQLDRILAGKSLYTAAELAERIREAHGADEEPDAVTRPRRSPTSQPATQATQSSERTAAARKALAEDGDEDEDFEEDEEPASQPATFAELTPERLVKGRKATARVTAYQARERDVDDDGKPELILPSWQGEIAIVSADGAHVRKLRLRGMGTNASIMSVRPVRLAGALHWLICYGNFGGYAGRTDASIGLFDDKGARLWQYRLPGGKRTNVNANLAVGDLTGDGVPEFVAGVTVAKMRKMGENSWTTENQRGYLLVLDAQGAPLVCKRMGQNAEYVAVAEPDSAGKRAILLFDSGTMHRLYYDPAATTRPAKDSAEEEEFDEDEEDEQE